MQPRALLAISHGTASPAGQAAVAALVAAVARRLPHVDVRLGHVDVQQPDVEASLHALGDRDVVLVPLLLSAGYHVHVDLARAVADRPRVRVAGALGPDERLADVMAARLADTLSAAGLPASSPVVMAAAGSSDERANEDCRAVGEMLAARLAHPVEVGFLAATEPRLADLAGGRDAGRPVVAASYLLAPGYFQDLAASSAPTADPLLLPGDTPPAMVDIVVDRYEAAWDGSSSS